jgi:hypothetical protein
VEKCSPQAVSSQKAIKVVDQKMPFIIMAFNEFLR